MQHQLHEGCVAKRLAEKVSSRFSVGFGGGFFGFDVDAATFLIEEDSSADQSKQCVVAAHSDVLAGVPFRAVLTDQNVAGNDNLTPNFFTPSRFALESRPLRLDLVPSYVPCEYPSIRRACSFRFSLRNTPKRLSQIVR